MKVRCTADNANPVFQDALNPALKWGCSITPGRIYLVLGLSFSIELMFHGRGVSVEIVDDDDQWAILPLRLFEIVDGRPSRYWRAKQIDQGPGLVLSPPSFQRLYWADDLTDGKPDIIADFDAVLAKLRAEFVD